MRFLLFNITVIIALVWLFNNEKTPDLKNIGAKAGHIAQTVIESVKERAPEIKEKIIEDFSKQKADTQQLSDKENPEIINNSNTDIIDNVRENKIPANWNYVANANDPNDNMVNTETKKQQLEPEFMSKKDRYNELHKLAHDMENLFIGYAFK